MALVMVRAGERGAPAVRLVQDLGGPADPDTATLGSGAGAATDEISSTFGASMREKFGNSGGA